MTEDEYNRLTQKTDSMRRMFPWFMLWLAVGLCAAYVVLLMICSK